MAAGSGETSACPGRGSSMGGVKVKVGNHAEEEDGTWWGDAVPDRSSTTLFADVISESVIYPHIQDLFTHIGQVVSIFFSSVKEGTTEVAL